MNKSKLKTFYKKKKYKSPLIVFVHGAACDHTVWAFQSRYFFSQGYSTMSLDLPGHGNNNTVPLNTIKEISNLIKILLMKSSHKEIYLVGHSMGSLICLETSLARLKIIKGIFLLGVSYPMNVNQELLKKSKKFQDLAIKDMINWSLRDQIKLNGSNLIGINLPNLINVIMSKSKKGLLYTDLKACNNYVLDYSKIKKNLSQFTIIAGSLDLMTPVKSSMKLSDNLPNSNLEIIKNAGHFLNLEYAEEVNNMILRNIKNYEKKI